MRAGESCEKAGYIRLPVPSLQGTYICPWILRLGVFRRQRRASTLLLEEARGLMRRPKGSERMPLTGLPLIDQRHFPKRSNGQRHPTRAFNKIWVSHVVDRLTARPERQACNYVVRSSSSLVYIRHAHDRKASIHPKLVKSEETPLNTACCDLLLLYRVL